MLDAIVLGLILESVAFILFLFLLPRRPEFVYVLSVEYSWPQKPNWTEPAHLAVYDRMEKVYEHTPGTTVWEAQREGAVHQGVWLAETEGSPNRRYRAEKLYVNWS